MYVHSQPTVHNLFVCFRIRSPGVGIIGSYKYPIILMNSECFACFAGNFDHILVALMVSILAIDGIIIVLIEKYILVRAIVTTDFCSSFFVELLQS